MYHGDFPANAILDFKFNTAKADGTPITLSGSAVVKAYKSNQAATEITTGITMTIDFDGLVGCHHISVNLSTDTAFYNRGSNISLVLTAGTVDSVSVVGAVIGSFSVERSVDFRIVDAGVFVAVGGLTVTLPTTANNALNFFANCRIKINSGLGFGQVRTILSGTTGRVQTIDQAWVTVPDTTSGYQIIGDSIMQADVQKVGNVVPTIPAEVSANVAKWAGVTVDPLYSLFNTALNDFSFVLRLKTDHVTPATGKASFIVAERSIDGGNFAACTDTTITEIQTSGCYKIDLSAADKNGTVVLFRFTSSDNTCDPVFLTMITKD